jgi:2-polyprenyl-3-methyl-5-hydroxy-6-metoxy-1,4-benzoquinol methylase
MKRLVVPELLDSDSGTSHEVEGSLADLRMFNLRFGGIRAMSALLREVASRRGLKEMDWLDVGGGAGDVATLTSKSLSHSGIVLRPVVLDRASSHLNGTHVNVCGNALALPFRDASFDVVGSSLFVHHLEPAELVRFAAEGLRVARHAFVINDLIRHPLHLALAIAGRPIYRSRITRHDAPVSVRRAYTVDEVHRILAETGAVEITIRTFYLFRMGVIAWKKRDIQPSMI